MPVDYKLKTLRRLFGEKNFLSTVKSKSQRPKLKSNLPINETGATSAALEEKDTLAALPVSEKYANEAHDVDDPFPSYLEDDQSTSQNVKSRQDSNRDSRRGKVAIGGIAQPFFHGIPPRPIRNKAVAGQLGIVHLFEKQKMRVYYGAMRDFKFKRYVDDARRRRFNIDAELMRLLETRLDTLLYRTGFVQTPSQGRQWIHHAQVLVNGSPLTSKGARLRPGDVISVRDEFVERALDASMRAAAYREELGVGSSWILGSNAKEGLLPWMVIDRAGLAAVLVRDPTDHEVRAMCRAALFPYIRDAQLDPLGAMRAYR